MSHTYAIVEVSPPVFNEIAQKLKAAGHDASFIGKAELDMHGLALAPDMSLTPGTTRIETLSLLSSRTKKGRVQLRINEETVQMDLDKAREVVGLIQSAIEAAVSDQLIYQFLTQKVGLSEGQAGNALLDFRELRQGSLSVVFPS